MNAQTEPELLAILQQAAPGSQDRQRAFSKLRPTISAASIPVMRTLLASGSDSDGVAAVQILAKIHTPESTGALVDSLAISSPTVLSFAARALSARGARHAVPEIQRCLQERNDELDEASTLSLLRALGMMPHASSVTALSSALRDNRPAVRRRAAWALSNIRAPEATAALQAVVGNLPLLQRRAVRRVLAARLLDEG